MPNGRAISWAMGNVVSLCSELNAGDRGSLDGFNLSTLIASGTRLYRPRKALKILLEISE